MSGSEGLPETTLDRDLTTAIKRRRNQLLIVIITFIVAVVALVLFVGLTVFRIQVLPERAKDLSSIHTVDGTVVMIGHRALLFGTKANIQIDAIGYFSEEVLLYKHSPVRWIDLELRPKPGIVTVHVDSPYPFDIYIDDSQISSKSPVTQELNLGIHEVRIAGSEIITIVEEIQVEGYAKEQSFSFVPERSSSTFSLQTEPSNATIELDGYALSEGTYEGGVSRGEHSLTIRADNFLPREISFSIDHEQHVDLGLIKLDPAPAHLKIRSIPSNAAVLVGSEYIGSTPMEFTFDTLGTKELTIRKSNYQTATTSLVLEAGGTYEQSVVLKPTEIELNVRSTPQASVAVNGTTVGQTPQQVTVHPKDVIEVFKDAYATERRIVDVAGPASREMEFTLVLKDQSEFNSAPDEIVVLDEIKLRKFPTVTMKLAAPRDASGSARAFELTRPFYIGTHEVTQKSFARFEGKTSQSGQSSDLPIANITWTQAAKFCNWLSAQSSLKPVYSFSNNELIDVDFNSRGYRLPTEAEWEAVAQYDFNEKQSIGPYSWGTSATPPDGIENLSGRESRHNMHSFLANFVDNHVGLAPVGSYPQNINKIHDISGNVSEWVHDYYEGTDVTTTEKRINPYGPAVGFDHLVKGANFRTHNVDETHVGSRHVVGYKDETVGFRIAKWIL